MNRISSTRRTSPIASCSLIALALALLVTLGQFSAAATLAAPLTPKGVAATTLVPCNTWDLATDFRVAPNQENPSRDACANPNVWYYMTGPENRDPAAYTLLSLFTPNFNVEGLQAWYRDITSPPTIVLNPFDIPVNDMGAILSAAPQHSRSSRLFGIGHSWLA